MTSSHNVVTSSHNEVTLSHNIWTLSDNVFTLQVSKGASSRDEAAAIQPSASEEKGGESTESDHDIETQKAEVGEAVVGQRRKRLRKPIQKYTPTKDRPKVVGKVTKVSKDGEEEKEGKAKLSICPFSVNPEDVVEKKKLDSFSKFIKAGLVRGHSKM